VERIVAVVLCQAVLRRNAVQRRVEAETSSEMTWSPSLPVRPLTKEIGVCALAETGLGKLFDCLRNNGSSVLFLPYSVAALSVTGSTYEFTPILIHSQMHRAKTSPPNFLLDHILIDPVQPPPIIVITIATAIVTPRVRRLLHTLSP
jgi:hypothetical protein